MNIYIKEGGEFPLAITAILFVLMGLNALWFGVIKPWLDKY